MSRQVRIQVQPNEILRFPGLCVNCSKQAADSMLLEQQNGRIIRRIDVPVCEQCSGLLRRESGEEERMRKLSWLMMIAAVLLIAALLLVILSSVPFWLRIFLAILGGAIAAGIVKSLFRRVIDRAALPEKKKVREAARLEAFSARTATFIFANDSFAERFVELNQPAAAAI